MLYSSKQDISSLAEQEDTELEDREQDQDVEQPVVGPVDLEQNKLDPLEGLDEATKICFLVFKLVCLLLGKCANYTFACCIKHLVIHMVVFLLNL